jgi:hypothetical protein
MAGITMTSNMRLDRSRKAQLNGSSITALRPGQSERYAFQRSASLVQLARIIGGTMIKRYIQTAWFLSVLSSLILLVLPNTSNAKLIPRRDPRAGVLDANHVVLVKQEVSDQFQIEEVYLGDSKPGDIINLPGFKLFTYQQYGPDIVEPITPDTRILLFLKHKEEDMSAWEITAYGYCFFWVHSLDKVYDLRKMARDSVALRKSWEVARDQLDERSRVEALWPFLWNNDGYFLRHTEAELKKVGPVAGDYIAQQFDAMTHDQRMELVRELGDYASSYSRQALLKHLKKLQQTHEKFLEQQGPNAKNLIEDWNTAPDEIKNIYGELYYGLAGLAKFKDQSDLPYIRELALWAVRYRFKQTCDAALEAFESMPDRSNLPVIDSIWNEFTVRPYHGNELTSWEVVRALHAHIYPEAVPLLVRFLDDRHTEQEAREALKEIAGIDAGKNPRAWLDWYKAQKQEK